MLGSFSTLAQPKVVRHSGAARTVRRFMEAMAWMAKKCIGRPGPFHRAHLTLRDALPRERFSSARPAAFNAAGGSEPRPKPTQPWGRPMHGRTIVLAKC